jgi:uncharacterized protein
VELRQVRGAGPYIQSYDDGILTIDDAHYSGSVIIHAEHDVRCWRPQALADIQAEDIEDLVQIKPSVLLLGTGLSLEFPLQALLLPFYTAHIGVEVMDTAAACRTYNVLMAEGRDVLAVLMAR